MAVTGRFALNDVAESVEILVFAGREEWALSHLIVVGDHGYTPIDTTGPRWSDYVFDLRRGGIGIATIAEAHGGPYAGHDSRYVLKSKVERLLPLQVAA